MNRSERLTRATIALGYRNAAIHRRIYDAVLLIKLWGKLGPITKRCQSASNSSSLGLLNIIWEASGFLRLCARCYATFTIFDDGSEYGKAIGTLDHFFTAPRLAIPGKGLFLSFTIKIKLNYFG